MPMRTITTFCFLTVLMISCGICDILLPVTIPQRYVERRVQDDELIGLWKLTSDSEARIDTYIRGDSSRSIGQPWKTMSINDDGTCQVQIESGWMRDNENILNETDALSSCTWRSKEVLGYNEGGAFRYVPGLSFRFEHFNSQNEIYEIYSTELFIAEENNELIVWEYIEGPFEIIKYQDFKKFEE